MLEIGRIAKAHGLKGEVIVELFTNREERLTPGSVLTAPGGPLVILHSHPHQHRYIVAFAGVESREDAEALHGTVLSAEPLEDSDALWVHELVGAEVLDVGGDNVGVVKSILANPAGDIIETNAGILDSASLCHRTRPRLCTSRPARRSLRSQPRLTNAVRIDVFTIFPQLIEQFCAESLLGRAQKNQLVQINAHDIRSGTNDKHRSVDDTPFGGGAGMVLAPEPIYNVIEQVKPPRPLYLLSPGGPTFNQAEAIRLSQLDGFSLLCGRYEGVDQRIIDNVCDGELSLGDFVIAGGEVAALTVIEAVTRLVPGVMGNDQSAGAESFGADGLLEYPQYTRPAEFHGWTVPAVLQSGDHGAIEKWRKEAALERTRRNRPDLAKPVD